MGAGGEECKRGVFFLELRNSRVGYKLFVAGVVSLKAN